MKALWLSILLILPFNDFEGWDVFTLVQYELKYIEQFGGEFDVPVFPAELKARDGKEFVLEGHYLPFDIDEKTIVISKFPYAACFFCGGSGPETIAEIQLAKKLSRRLKPDEIIKVKGKLKLNDSDYDHYIFILEEASIIEVE